MNGWTKPALGIAGALLMLALSTSVGWALSVSSEHGEKISQHSARLSSLETTDHNTEKQLDRIEGKLDDIQKLIMENHK